jgi:hypothetical protein
LAQDSTFGTWYDQAPSVLATAAVVATWWTIAQTVATAVTGAPSQLQLATSTIVAWCVGCGCGLGWGLLLGSSAPTVVGQAVVLVGHLAQQQAAAAAANAAAAGRPLSLQVRRIPRPAHLPAAY